MPLPISVVVPTKNGEVALPACLDSLSGWFDEIIVVDSDSTDGTKQVAEAHGVDFVNFRWNRRYPKKKQWCMNELKLRNAWILFVDADERVSEPFVSELKRLAEAGFDGHKAFDVPLAYHWRGHALHHGQVVTKRVLLHVSDTYFPELNDLDAPGMGEQEGHYQPRVRGTVGQIKSKLDHDDPDPLSTWIARHNRYSDWEAHLRANPELRKSIRRLRSRQGQILEAVPGKPLVTFLYNYLIRSGWRDGRPGFEYAISLAIYQWQVALKTRELKERAGRAEGSQQSTPTTRAVVADAQHGSRRP